MERSAYRIIDANFNRAREALRVIEDYARFSLNCASLSVRTKDLRHRLCSAVAQVDNNRLLAGRDTICDVGIGQKTENTIGRSDLKDSLTAACKRLPEALRVIAEVIRLDNMSIAEQIEKIRYESYTLEKDVLLFADTQARFGNVRLYVIINSNLPADIFSLAGKCIAGGADCLQLRAKNVNDDKYLAIAKEFVTICSSAGIISVINDRVDIAVASGADGVHLGQNDIPIAEARKLQLPPLIIGKSTHSTDELALAIAELPTYVSIGPMFMTPTKPDIKPVGIDYLKKVLPILSGTGIKHVTIGGINVNNIDSVLNEGAKTIAVSSAITGSPDPAGMCLKFKQKMASFLD